MFVQTIPEKKTGRTLICYYVGRRINGKTKQFLVEKLGYLDEFTDKYPDPLAHFKEEAKRLTLEEKARKQTLEYSLGEHFDFSKEFDKAEAGALEKSSLVRSYGVLPLLRVYRDLELDYFLDIKRQYRKTGYNHNHIFQMLVFGRILSPDSKLGTWRDRNRLLFNADFSDDDVYRSLEFFSSVKTDMIRHLNNQMVSKYRRRTTLMYYDVTNYYWETDEDDDLRKRGCSKEHRPEPIVQMGLFMDSEGLPVTYGLFPGNTNDVITMRPMMDRLLDGLGNRDYIYVADKGIMSGMNIAQIVLDNKGYVISDSVRKATKAMKDYVLKQDDYLKSEDGSFKYKSRFYPREIRVETSDGKQRLIRINERQIVFWSEKYFKRQKQEREKVMEKALDRSSAKGANSVLNNHAGNMYIKKLIFDSSTGKEVTQPEFRTEIDSELISQQEQLDGYYIIRTNVVGISEDASSEDFNGFDCRWHPADNFLELDHPVSDMDIIDIYRGLWQIEDSFRITKSILRARPVFVHNESSIEAHFLSCFVSLLILRLLEKKTGCRIPVRTIADSLRKANLAELPNGGYMSTYCDNVINDIGKALGLQLNRKFYSKRDLVRERGKTVKKI
ncbi:MAG: IS1634 family transposase [Spirochaetales bacterium]|nr:IS1634 family transposase [Spirochaetales bacterium]MBR0520360.1 IS1634 family transposase [Spirochaetales bacterium]